MPPPAPAVVILAKITMDESIHIEDRAPTEVHVAEGQDLQIRILYRTIEASKGKETYRLRLDSNLGLLRQDPVTVEHHDRPALDEENWGSLQQRYRPRQPGTHTLEYTLRARYDVEPWGGGSGAGHHEEAERRGTIQVTVA
jgi:hypothetical protein